MTVYWLSNAADSAYEKAVILMQRVNSYTMHIMQNEDNDDDKWWINHVWTGTHLRQLVTQLCSHHFLHIMTEEITHSSNSQ